MKFLLVLLVVVGGLWLILKRDAKGSLGSDAAPPAPAPKDASPEVTAMVACARCGVQFPHHEAMRDAQGRVYCSQDHLVAGAR